jgi:hypothetical protein
MSGVPRARPCCLFLSATIECKKSAITGYLLRSWQKEHGSWCFPERAQPGWAVSLGPAARGSLVGGVCGVVDRLHGGAEIATGPCSGIVLVPREH